MTTQDLFIFEDSTTCNTNTQTAFLITSPISGIQEVFIHQDLLSVFTWRLWRDSSGSYNRIQGAEIVSSEAFFDWYTDLLTKSTQWRLFTMTFGRRQMTTEPATASRHKTANLTHGTFYHGPDRRTVLWTGLVPEST